VKCSEVQQRLSSFHDNELSQEEAARVQTHVTHCSSCEKELADFQQLSELSRQLADPPVLAHRWEELQSKLNLPNEPSATLARNQPWQIPRRFLALAATLLVAVGIGILVYQGDGTSPEQRHLAINFAHYLETFSEQPGDAQKILLAKYEGQTTTLAEATKTLGYEPVAVKSLPPGYTVQEVQLLKMPCCTCAQVLCVNKAGESIAIFEYAIDQPVWFGNRPSKECLCHDVPTDIRQIGDRLAATWKEGNRFITIIGAADLEEVTAFIAHFKQASSS